LDVATKLSGQVYNFAGGLFAYPNLVIGKWTLGGLVQNEWIWGLELTDAQTWISISPNSGSLAGGMNQDVTVMFDATELLPGIYEAEIHFTSTPNVGVPVVQVEMTVDDGTFIEDLDEELIWINVFPNPFKDKLNIQSPVPISQLELFSNSGKCILKENGNGIFFELNAAQLNPGIYFLKLHTNQGQVIRKLVIE